MGSCGGSPCDAYEVALFSNNTYSYTVYPHRRVFTGRIAFSETARDLLRTPFFWQTNPETESHGNWPAEITIYAQYHNGAREISVIPKDDGYSAYQAFTKSVTAPVLSDVAARLTREERTLRDSQSMLAVSVLHSPLLGCPFYKAVFTPTSKALIEYSPPLRFTRHAAQVKPSARIESHTIAARIPFDAIKNLVKRNRVASLYEDYPTMGADQPFVNVVLTYKTSSYTIEANEPQFWPIELRNFTSAVDRMVLNQLSRAGRTCKMLTGPRNSGQ